MIFVFSVSKLQQKIFSIPDTVAVEQNNITFKWMHIPRGSQKYFYFPQFHYTGIAMILITGWVKNKWQSTISPFACCEKWTIFRCICNFQCLLYTEIRTIKPRLAWPFQRFIVSFLVFLHLRIWDVPKINERWNTRPMIFTVDLHCLHG